MDDIDRKILAVMQENGRLSITEVAERIGLSLSPCHRRVRALEEAGVISGYRTTIAPLAVGLTFSAIVFATLRESTHPTLLAFEAAVLDLPEVISAERLFGEPDYMLHIVTKDLAAFQALYDRKLSALPGVLKMTSTLVMKSVCQHRPLPL